MNYKVTKIGLLNFWYFDSEEFNFYDGKLLLRGGNGSGKSVTMQSFIPLILDGNKTPTRLDPFGTKEKKIEDYLLGPSDGEQKEDSIGYLYMEVYDNSKDKYITIGIGLHARKARPTEFWGFALKDGKRIGIDFNLYKSYSNKVLMTKKELRAAIGIDNIVVETQKEYKSLVNELLFGFADIDSYDEFINVLLQLRSPKLSKEYTPTKLMSILSSVLQPLTESDIKPLSEAIEDTNKTKEKIDSLNSNIKALSNLLKVYQNYNEIYLYNKALLVYEGNEEVNKTKKINLESEKNINNITNRLNIIDASIKALDEELVNITTKLSTIDNKDLKRYTEELDELNKKVNDTKISIDNLKKKLEEKINTEIDINNNIKKLDDELYSEDRKITDIKLDVVSLMNDINLSDLISNIESNDINFDYIEDRLSKYKNKLNSIKTKLEEKEKIEDKINSLEEEIEKVKKNLSESESLRKNYLNDLSSEIDNFKDKINSLEKLSNVVKIDENRKRRIFDLINNYSSNNYLRAHEEYQTEIKYYNTISNSEKNNIENKINNENIELNLLSEELNLLKSTNESEFVDDTLKDSELKLSELNIPFIPLYKAIEFKDNISEIEKDKIEELLISMNILNAKIVPFKYLESIKNIKSVFLKKGKFKKNNILTYFNILDNDIVDSKEIEDILSSISIDNTDEIYITPNNYEFDFLIGYSSDKYKSKYIGILKRQEEHKRKIEEKLLEIQEKESLINTYKNNLDKIINELNDISNMEKMFPDNENLEKINISIIKLDTSIENIAKTKNDLIEKSNDLNNLIRQKIEEITKIKENITIPLNLISYIEALKILDELKDYISKLKNVVSCKNNLFDQRKFKGDSLNEIRDEIQEKNFELSVKDKEYGEFVSKKKAIEEILSNPDYQLLINELKVLTERKNEIPKKREELIEEKGRLENSKENLIVSLEHEKENLEKNILKLELKTQILKQEYNLKYVYDEEELDVNKIISDLKNRENSDLLRTSENYMKAFMDYKQELLDYHLTTKEIFNNDEELLKIYTLKGLNKKEIKEILNYTKRQDMEALYQGRKLNIFELTSCLKEAVIESENYINIQERHLFEDILLQTVGSKIRNKIESSKKWVQKINEIMRSTGENSNLSFELEWKSKVAFTENELDTKELIRIFKIDAGQLTDSDKEKLRTHFISQIKQELEFNEKSNESYTDIVFRVLDYRNWFEFKIYYKRKSGERRELTNKVFSVLSGGERAKSMYVPLFASVYAKLLNASDNALRLIALDEAFAGVDNVNIREMFAILSQLNLDYILTSQSLWGDYDSVNDLSICELIKDEIHKAVAVRHYRWNGKVKEILE